MVNENAGNERNMNRRLKAILLSAGLCSLPSLCYSAVVYDNLITADPQGRQYYPTNNPTLEFGDQITLDNLNNTGARTLSHIDFYYFFSGTTVTTETWRFRLYANDGVNGAPGTVLFPGEERPVTLGDRGFNNQPIDFTLAVPPIVLPETFTWTVQFSNLGAGETGGLLVYGPPAVGTSFPDFWQNDSTGWNRFTIGAGAVSDFAARFTTVPEPGVLALGGLGALLLAGLRRFRKAPA